MKFFSKQGSADLHKLASETSINNFLFSSKLEKLAFS